LQNQQSSGLLFAAVFEVRSRSEFACFFSICSFLMNKVIMLIFVPIKFEEKILLAESTEACSDDFCYFSYLI